MRRGAKAVLLGTGALVVLAGGWTLLEERRTRDELEGLRSELRALRAAADSCQVAVAQEEMLFRDYDRRVDSLRAEVTDYESLHPEGVPADTYSVYLETFDRYNDAVPAWRMQVESLRAHWEACRETVDAHNRHADSLRLRLEQLEMIDPPGADATPPGPGAAPRAAGSRP